MYSVNANGISALTWADINQWLQCTERKLDAWEKETIREMSRWYVAEYYEAKEPSRPAPYQSLMSEEILNAKRKAVASAWKAKKAALKEE